MKTFTCKKCNTKNSIQNEWIEMGVNRIVNCISCNNRMNLRLENYSKKHLSDSQNTTNTVVSHKSNAVIKSLDIIVISDLHKDRKVTVQANNTRTIFFGRDPLKHVEPKNDNYDILMISDPHLSRLHGVFKVVFQKGIMLVSFKDVGSTNGTQVNDNNLSKDDIILLKNNDKIFAGNTILKIVVNNEENQLHTE